MRHWTAAIITLALTLAACDGRVITAKDGAGGETADGGGGAGGASSTAGGPTTQSGGSVTGTTPSTECVVQDPPPDILEPTCEDLGGLTLLNPTLDAGDGLLSPGETGTLTVHLVDLSGAGFGWYPLVNFASDHPSVTVTNDAILYAILPCQDTEMATLVTVDGSVAPGTVVHVTAQIGMLSETCPDALTMTIPIPIQ